MIQLFTLITLLIGFSMFFLSRDKKIALMFIGCMTLELVRLGLPIFSTANFFLIGCFIISEIKNISLLLQRLNRNPIFLISLFLLISLILALLFSPHLHSIKEASKFLQSELVLKYFAIGYGFCSIRNGKNMRTIIRYSIIPMLILTLFGVINMIEGRSNFVTEMMSNWKSLNDVNEMGGDKFIDSGRFRVQAMFFNPFNYGYTCLLCLNMYLYGYSKKMINKTLLLLLTVCCLFGILMCGARTVIVCSIISVSVLLLFSYKIHKSIYMGLLAICVATMAYMTIPIVNEKVDQMTTIVSDTKGRDIGGSNVEMRTIQFATVLYYIKDTPEFGRGVRFFYYDMGWNKGKTGLRDSRLYGLEGVYLTDLLERGFVGYFLYLSIWIVILIYLLKFRHYNRELSALGISIWLQYMIFANMTGELSSAFPTLLLIGCIFGVLNTNKLIYGIKSKILHNNTSL